MFTTYIVFPSEEISISPRPIFPTLSKASASVDGSVVSGNLLVSSSPIVPASSLRTYKTLQ